MKELISAYENACEDIVRSFCIKHDYLYEEDSWVGGNVGDVAIVGDYIVPLSVMVLDLKENADKDEFVRWYDYQCGGGICNYKSWLKGYKHIVKNGTV